MDPLTSARWTSRAMYLCSRLFHNLKDFGFGPRGSGGYISVAKLGIQDVLLRNTLITLFREALPPAVVTDQMLDRPTEELWSNDLVLFHIAEYLGNSYNEFYQTAKGIRDTTENISRLVIRTQRQRNSRSVRGLLVNHGRAITMSLSMLQNMNLVLHTIVTRRISFQSRSLGDPEGSSLRDIRGMIEQPPREDQMSIHTVETEVFGNSASLSFLEVGLTGTRERPHDEVLATQVDALLDTGASRCCISAELAAELEITVIASDSQTITTATFGQPMFQSGMAKLKLEWGAEEHSRISSKMWAYVIPELSVPLILSHDFTSSHPEVWELAKKEKILSEHINVLRFGRLKTRDEEVEKDFQSKRAQDNAKQEQAEHEQTLDELEKQLDKLRPTDTPDGTSAEASTTAIGQTSSEESSSRS